MQAEVFRRKRFIKNLKMHFHIKIIAAVSPAAPLK